MGENVLKKSVDKPDSPEAIKRNLEAAQLSSVYGAMPMTATQESPSQTKPVVEAKADNSLSHLTGVAVSSLGKGLWEPVAGGIQFTEQVANTVTTHTPGVHKAFFNPENLSPNATASAEPPKYSAEWYVKTVGENVGKLPWYLLAAKGMSKVPGFKAEAGVLSETRMLGMSIKTSAASGFMVSALGPTDVTKDGSLLGSIKERTLQGTIGAGQMAVMTGTTALVGKGYMAAERALTSGEAVSATKSLTGLAEAAQKSNLQGITGSALKFIKNGSIATVGAIPAGLGAGYINAKAHGTEFDPVENLVATSVVGFGLGGFGPGPEGVPHTTEARAKAPAETRTDAVGSETKSTSTALASIAERAKSRILDLKARVAAITAGGPTPELGLAFNGYDGIPASDHAAARGVDASKVDAAPGAKDASARRNRTDGAKETKPTAGTTDGSEPGAEPPDTGAKKYRTKFRSEEAKATFTDVFTKLMDASKEGSTKAHEDAFVEAAVKAPWTITKLRADLTSRVESNHIDGLLNRADEVVRQNAMAEEKVPPAARAAFGKGYDILRGVAEAANGRNFRAALKELNDFAVSGDDVLRVQDQLRSAARKLGGTELEDRFEQAFDKRYDAIRVHQLEGEHAPYPGQVGEVAEVRATQVERFKDIVLTAKMVSEAHTDASPEVTTRTGRPVKIDAQASDLYTHLREQTADLNPDMKASLIDYARKTNDVRFSALINDLLVDPKGDTLPNAPIYLDIPRDLERAWDNLHNIISDHPTGATPGEAPSVKDVAAYRESVFNALNGADPRLVKLAQSYGQQTANSFEASALDYYYGGNRLDAFKSVTEAKQEAYDAYSHRNEYVVKPAKPAPLNLETGVMEPGNGYLQQLKTRLGGEPPAARVMWNGTDPLSVELKQATNLFVDPGNPRIQRAVFKGRADGLTKINVEPDLVSDMRGGKHYTAIYENNPEGILQVDEYADGTRWVRQRGEDNQESRTAWFPDGSVYSYINKDAWLLDFPNGNSVIAYPDGPVAREINENGHLTQIGRDGNVIPRPEAEEQPAQNTAEVKPPTTDELFNQMQSAVGDRNKLTAAAALADHIGSMSDQQFHQWISFLKETPNEPNARPNYMHNSSLRALRPLLESNALDDPQVRSEIHTLLSMPGEGQFSSTYPKYLNNVEPAKLAPWLLNDIRARFSHIDADGQMTFAPDVPQEMRDYLANSKPTELRDLYNNPVAPPPADTFAARLELLPQLGEFKPEVSARLLELGAQDPTALRDVLRAIKDPNNDIPSMRNILSETIPNADDIYTIKVLLDSMTEARRAFRAPEVQQANRDTALAILRDLTGGAKQDSDVGAQIDEFIKARSQKQRDLPPSQLAQSLDLGTRTKGVETVEASEHPPQNLTKDKAITPATPVEDLVSMLQSGATDRQRLDAARALNDKLDAMDDAQFHEWIKFLGQDSIDAPIRPNYMKIPGLRDLGDIIDSGRLDDPRVEKALQAYLQASEPGAFRLDYPALMQGLRPSDMPPWLLNDVRDRFSSKTGSTMAFQDDVPPEMRDYLQSNPRLEVKEGKRVDRRTIGEDNEANRLAALSEAAKFQPDVAAKLLELGADDPRSLSDVMRQMSDNINDFPEYRKLLEATLPNAHDIYTVKVLLDSISKARRAWRSEESQQRADNRKIALQALSELTGDKGAKGYVDAIIKKKGDPKMFPQSKLADQFTLEKPAPKPATPPPPPEAPEGEPETAPETDLQGAQVVDTPEVAPELEHTGDQRTDEQRTADQRTEAVAPGDNGQVETDETAATTGVEINPQVAKFNAKYGRARQSGGGQGDGGNNSGRGDRSGKPQTFTSFQDLGEAFANGGDDQGRGNRADKRAQGRDRDRQRQERRDRRDGGDDDEN